MGGDKLGLILCVSVRRMNSLSIFKSQLHKEYLLFAIWVKTRNGRKKNHGFLAFGSHYLMAVGTEGFQEGDHHTHTHTHTHTHGKWPTSVWGRSWHHYSHPSRFLCAPCLLFVTRIAEALACWPVLLQEGERPQTAVELRSLADVLKQWFSSFLSAGPIFMLKTYWGPWRALVYVLYLLRFTMLEIKLY